jgi:hypothetical protein
MATGLIQPPHMHSFSREDASSLSNLSIYTTEAHNRFTSGDFIFQHTSNLKQHTRPSNFPEAKKVKTVSIISKNKKAKPTKEFTVSRKNSYKVPYYYKLGKKVLKSENSNAEKRLSKFDEPDQLKPVFDLFPQTSLVDNPSYTVQYFSKPLDILKKDPIIRYQILKAQIEANVPASNDEALKKQSKQRKYQSLPIFNTNTTIQEEKKLLRSNQRKSAPVYLTYKPIDMTLTEYLNTPLDFYQHKKQASITTSSNLSKETRLTEKSGQSLGAKTKSSESYGDSISTSALSLNRNQLVDKRRYSTKKSRALKTKRKDSIVKRRSILPKEPDYANKMLNDDALRRRLSTIKQQTFSLKYGTPILETNAKPIVLEGTPLKPIKRNSQCGDMSIATGNEIYNDIKRELFGNRFENWEILYKHLKKTRPDLVDNSYFLTRFMFEIYLRRVLAAKIALKLGSDKSLKSSGNEVWIGLKESIAVVYGEDNASFFESRNK